MNVTDGAVAGVPGDAGANRSARVLLVDDERSVLDSLARFLTTDGHEVVAVTSTHEAVLELERASFDVMITDVILHDGNGVDLLRTARDRWPDLLVVAMSGYGTIESAVEAMKVGAFEFLSKPVRMDEIRQVARRAIEQQNLLRANRSLRRMLDAPYNLDVVIGRTYQMQRVFDLIEAVADSKTTVLIHGETGTGKSVVARAIHQRSQRRARPFVEISCGAIPETLLASELFGHVKGAFTGALADKDGKFRAADGGTIFLDEVACASPSLQVKLLRILQERQFEPLGSNRTATVDVRVILATNVNLAQEVEAGRFRPDLFYRINVVNIDLPPLRDRLTDIPLLAEHFLRKCAHQCGKRRLAFTEPALQCMQRYRWPGNVRELENCVERAVVLTRGEQIDVADLPPAVVRASESDATMFSADRGRPLTLKEALEEPEKRIIQAALEANAWNRQKTAAVLDVNRTTLYKKMKQYGLEEPRKGRKPQP
ncbi:MAG: sigma-54-dependent Fis family transcriptional regulator [Phycisphaerae bacterium]|jgi:DNA-binding NtrC family response regulator|nr:sigma-54-dependent Fis family transcriptional regulator [Phycisphaerae bacterium]